MRLRPILLSCVLGLVFGACGDDDGSGTSTPPPPPAADALSAMIGPEGGTLEGQPDTQFEGVRLEIPAGALTEATLVQITPTLDETPLPSEEARLCGPAFAIAPAGTVLAAAASLTLPTDPQQVGSYGQGPDEVRAWVRDGEGWMQHPAMATEDGRVTIELATLATAAAGIVSRVGPPLMCSSSGGTVTCAAACMEADGFCVEDIMHPSSAPSPTGQGPFVVDGATLYFRSISGSSRAVRFTAGESTAVVRDLPFNGSPPRLPALERNAAGDPVAFWIGQSAAGNIRCPFPSGAVEQFDLGGIGAGAIVGPSSNVLRITSTNLISGTTRLPFPTGVSGALASATATPDQLPASSATGFWAVPSSSRLRNIAIDGLTTLNDIQTGLTETLFADSSTRLSATGTRVAARFAKSGQDIVMVHSTTVSSDVVALGAGFPEDISDIALDNAGGLWIANATAPQVLYRSAAGGVSSTLLTTARAGTPEYNAHIPRYIALSSDGALYVLTAALRFTRVRRAAM